MHLAAILTLTWSRSKSTQCHHWYKLCRDWFPDATWVWRPSWSYDMDHLYKFLFPLPKETLHKIWLWLAKRFQEDVWHCWRRQCSTSTATTMGARAWVDYKLTSQVSQKIQRKKDELQCETVRSSNSYNQKKKLQWRTARVTVGNSKIYNRNQ